MPPSPPGGGDRETGPSASDVHPILHIGTPSSTLATLVAACSNDSQTGATRNGSGTDPMSPASSLGAAPTTCTNGGDLDRQTLDRGGRSHRSPEVHPRLPACLGARSPSGRVRVSGTAGQVVVTAGRRPTHLPQQPRVRRSERGVPASSSRCCSRCAAGPRRRRPATLPTVGRQRRTGRSSARP